MQFLYVSDHYPIEVVVKNQICELLRKGISCEVIIWKRDEVGGIREEGNTYLVPCTYKKVGYGNLNFSTFIEYILFLKKAKIIIGNKQNKILFLVDWKTLPLVNSANKCLYLILDMPNYILTAIYENILLFLKNNHMKCIIATSPGFLKRYNNKLPKFLIRNLPKKSFFKYFDKEKNEVRLPERKIHIILYGDIRHFRSLEIFIDSINYFEGFFTLDIYGKTLNYPLLEKLVNKSKFVKYFGPFENKDLPEIISKYDVIYGIIDPNRNIKFAYIVRFAESIASRKPIIASLGTLVGDYCVKYGTGVEVLPYDSESIKLILNSLSGKRFNFGEALKKIRPFEKEFEEVFEKIFLKI